MSVTLYVFMLGAVAAVFGCCFFLLFARDYHAGAFGTAGLGLVALAALGRLAGLWDRGLESYVSPQGVMLWLGLALFLGRHVLKFACRAARRDGTWYRA